MRKLVFFLIVLAGLAVHLFYEISQSLETNRNDVSISMNDPGVEPASLSIAVVADIHLPEGREPLTKFRELLLEVKAAKPDLIVFLGDYIFNPNSEQLSVHRENIINAMKLVDPVPRAVVLGNYETWSNADSWLVEFDRLNVDVMENKVTLLETEKGPVCVRGLGDKHTDRFAFVDYPEGCTSLSKLTITHDPAGAFDSRIKGLVIAGHTHCGQISLPLIGPLWVPTDAPSEAHCGLYEEQDRSLFVTSGVGTAILPIRYGAPSEWDMVSLSIN